MVHTHPLVSKPSSSCINRTKCTNYNWHKRHFYVLQYFQFPCKGCGTYPSFYFLSILLCGPLGEQNPQFSKFLFFLLIILRSGCLAVIIIIIVIIACSSQWRQLVISHWSMSDSNFQGLRDSCLYSSFLDGLDSFFDYQFIQTLFKPFEIVPNSLIIISISVTTVCFILVLWQGLGIYLAFNFHLFSLCFLLAQTGKNSPNECPWYDSKELNREALVMLELWIMWTTS